MFKRILENTLLLFLSKGFNKVNTDEIASSAGISKRTLYRYYSSKEKLITDVIEFFKNQIRSKIDEVLKREDLSPIEKYKMILSHVAKLTSKVSKNLLIDLQKERPDIFEGIVAFRSNNIRSLASLLEEAKKQGDLRSDLNPSFATDILLAAINNILTPEYLIHHNHSFEESLETIISIFLDGILIRK
ncbi:TetR/AcrR family transcriptional regulator [Leptospira sp. 'Mane']|uniref:TetR/AcrR family transcriptional regulator n=1 Tax=Leptospira sp. 'Mane' TaxID=3387407 RepID=UPI00398B0145